MDLAENAEDNHTARSNRSPAVMAFSVEGSSSSISATSALFHARVTVLFMPEILELSVIAVLAAVVMNERASRDVMNIID